MRRIITINGEAVRSRIRKGYGNCDSNFGQNMYLSN